jgi:hypothetical protein
MSYFLTIFSSKASLFRKPPFMFQDNTDTKMWLVAISTNLLGFYLLSVVGTAERVTVVFSRLA